MRIGRSFCQDRSEAALGGYEVGVKLQMARLKALIEGFQPSHRGRSADATL